MNAAHEADRRASGRIRDIFRAFDPTIVEGAITDFSKLHSGPPVFCEVTPTSANEVSDLIKLSVLHGVPLRTRGRGHALNGSSVPRSSELVVNTGKLTRIWLDHPANGTVSVGSGAVLWTVDAWLRRQGLALPVLNDGYPGPSVGGYIAAGGFGPGSVTAGGFWNNVAEVTMVDGLGCIHVLQKESTLFPWMFGAMGQLGLVIEARLKIMECASMLPVGGSERGAVRAEDGSHSKQTVSVEAPDEAGRLFWFTLFVHEEKLDAAVKQLDSLERRHHGTFALRSRYSYRIKEGSVVAPLVWPHAAPCYAIGSWGILKNLTSIGIAGVLDFDADFTQLALSNGHRRYVQSEVPFGPPLYKRYFYPAVYSGFRLLKQELDPHDLLNRGCVFVK